jgi:hypothetical protein
MRATLTGALLFAGLGAVAAAPVPKEPPLPAVTAEHLKTSKSNVEQIALACVNYADSNNSQMPTNILDKGGKPLLSWRVAILPYIEQDQLYKQLKLDEPWDSENNKKLVEKMPRLYAPIRVKAKAGETFYQVFYGEGALFGPKRQPKYPASIPDGTSNTGMIFEAGEPVIWTKPVDLPFDAKKPLPKLGGLFDGDFHVGLCDGSVILVKKDFDANELKSVITPAGGEVIETDKLKK